MMITVTSSNTVGGYWYGCNSTDISKLPNIVTLTRLVLAPVPGLLFVYDMNLLAAAMFLLIVATDALDGYLARRFDRVTDLGKLLDPMVDKVLMTATMVAISFVYPLMWVLVLLTLVRDVSVTIMRGRALKRLCIISADKFGKLKMIAQSVGLLLLLLPYNVFVLYVAIVMLMLALILTIVSWVKYNTRYRTILVSAS